VRSAAPLVVAGSPHQHSLVSSRLCEDGAQDLLRSALSHPTAPHHMERVELERAPRCEVCLLRDRAIGTGPALAALRDAERPVQHPVEPPISTPLRRSVAPVRPRGPPLA
jgi:hypothetical protein